MITDNVRAAITQAKINEESSSLIVSEIVFAAVILGLFFQSFVIFGGTFLVFIVALRWRLSRILLNLLFSVFWMSFGYVLGEAFNSQGACVVLSILFLLASLGLHLSGFQWVEDLWK